ncbi:hypothetical protein BASA61_000634 [Batrachochytrium salamandrivorans]|nr:hypothetical protein BASA61_000634 [Batrachochytrium salamandrivorans]
MATNLINAAGQHVSLDEVFNERSRLFQELLEEDYGHNQYKEQIITMVQKGARRLLVNINHVRQHNKEYADGLLKSPMEYLPPFDKALNDVAKAVWGDQNPGQDAAQLKFYVGLEGSFGEHNVSPRNLSAIHLGSVVCLEGIVTRCSLVRPKVARSVHYCEETKIFYSREYKDGTSLENAVPTGSIYPKEDNEGRPLTTEFGFSTYRDYQTMSIQEMPERSPAGQLPRPTDVILDDDLVDREIHQPIITEDDAREIRKIAKRPDAFSLLSMSLAPSIFGHEYIKKALLLLMLGGVEKNLVNGTHLRGDVNMLLIGDPSVGKSQMLRFVLNLAPLAIATTGRGSSGVGLTAAVTQDKETGERTLEAGAMVLADRGVVCIDEFDKMSDIDRVAIHEVMEQQTVTIAKAGIHTSLNARCSVLAAANPAFGTYLDEKKPFENITLPDSLLSRFDLVFVVLDKTDDIFNRAISDHITRLHRFIPDGVEEGAPISESTMQSMSSAIFSSRAPTDKMAEQTPVFQAYNEMLHVGVRPSSSTPARGSSRRRKDVCDYISTRYAELRSREDGKQDQYRTMPLTPRTLETLIRLSTAHAKSRLSKTVELIDAEAAYEILIFALFKEVKPKIREKKAKTSHPEDDESSGSESDDAMPIDRTTLSSTNRHGDQSTSRASSVAGASDTVDQLSVSGMSSATARVAASLRTTRSSGAGSSRFSELLDASGSDMNVDESVVAGDMSQSTAHGTSSTGLDIGSGTTSASSIKPVQLTVARFDQIRNQLRMIRQRHYSSQGQDDTLQSELSLVDVMGQINHGMAGSQQIGLPELLTVVTRMSDENMGVWYQSDTETLMFI